MNIFLVISVSCAYLCVVRHAMATVRNFKETKTTNMTIQANASQKQKSCKANTHKPTHNYSTFVFALTHKDRSTFNFHLYL